MGRTLLLAIDVGTQSTRAALLGLDGALLASAGRAQELETPHAGWAEQDPELWWGHAAACVREALAQAGASPGEVLAVGVGGQMHGAVPLGADGRPLSRRVQLWCDKRSAAIVERFAALPQAARAARLAGSPPVANWVGFKIRWLLEHQPELYAQTWKFVQPKDYINYRLTGVVATDHSEASGSFLMGAESRAWSPELIELLGLDAAKLPEIRRAAEPIGAVTPEAAALTGLRAGTPVVAGGGDMLCALLAAGLTEPGVASDITGTSGIFSVSTRAPALDPRLMNLHHVGEGWVPFGITDSGGVALKWFKDSLCQAEVAEARARGVSPYQVLDERAAAAPPGSEGLLFFPYLLGERTLGTPHARAAFIGLTPRHGVGAMARAIMEGVTLELRRTLTIVAQAGHPVETIAHSGGGAYSDVWSQIKADIYQRPVVTFENSEGGLLGAAILAGVGAGAYPSAAEGARRCLRVRRTFTPDASLAGHYDALYGLFEELHDLLQRPFERLAQIAYNGPAGAD